MLSRGSPPGFQLQDAFNTAFLSRGASPKRGVFNRDYWPNLRCEVTFFSVVFALRG